MHLVYHAFTNSFAHHRTLFRCHLFVIRNVHGDEMCKHSLTVLYSVWSTNQQHAIQHTTFYASRTASRAYSSHFDLSQPYNLLQRRRAIGTRSTIRVLLTLIACESMMIFDELNCARNEKHFAQSERGWMKCWNHYALIVNVKLSYKSLCCRILPVRILL